MTSNTFLVLLILVGFHGVFYYRHLALKAGSWCLMQGALCASFFLIEGSSPNPLAQALAFDSAVVGFGLALVLFSAVLVLRARYKTLDLKEIVKKVQKL